MAETEPEADRLGGTLDVALDRLEQSRPFNKHRFQRRFST